MIKITEYVIISNSKYVTIGVKALLLSYLYIELCKWISFQFLYEFINSSNHTFRIISMPFVIT